MQYDMNIVDDTNFYSSQPSQSSQQYNIPTGFQDRYYQVNAPPQQPSLSLASSQQHPSQHQPPPPQPLPSPPPPNHPTSINSLLSHDTPPPTSRPHQHHHHHSHHHHHHHHNAPSNNPPRPSSGSSFYAPARLPPLPGSRMNHLVDPTDRDRDRVKREGYY
jgi:hypothetical protein